MKPHQHLLMGCRSRKNIQMECALGCSPTCQAWRWRSSPRVIRQWAGKGRRSLDACIQPPKASDNDNLQSGIEEIDEKLTRRPPTPVTDRFDKVASLAVWALYGGYIGWVYFSTAAPGNPVWNTSPDTIQEFIHESISLWYINPVLSWFDLSLLPDFPEHPVGEALFTFIVTWDVMMWPAMAADKKGVGVEKKRLLWYGSLALLTAFLLPYMALRLSNKNREATNEWPKLPASSKALGWFGLAIAAATLAWVLFARPEYGDIFSRLDFAANKLQSDRVFYALCLDCGIYAVIQFVLMNGAPLKYRLLPYLGLGLWLTEAE